MKSKEVRKHHIESFVKLSISERLDWAFAQGQFLANFRGSSAKLINKKMRRNGKKYFKPSDLA